MVITSGHSWLETNWDLSIGNEYQSPKTLQFHKLHSVKQTKRLSQRKPHRLLNPRASSSFLPEKRSNMYSLKLTLFQNVPTLPTLGLRQCTFMIAVHRSYIRPSLNVAKASPFGLLNPYPRSFLDTHYSRPPSAGRARRTHPTLTNCF